MIEQAKGVIAYRENLEMSDAFSRLRQQAAASGRTLSQVARDILLCFALIVTGPIISIPARGSTDLRSVTW